MNIVLKRINKALMIFDILIMISVICVLVFSFLSFFNIKVEKTEDYIKGFRVVLNAVYLLVKIAIVHLFILLARYCFKKANAQIGGENGFF